jgi:hypothetical protein
MIGSFVNNEGCGRKWSWSNLRYCSGICLERLRKTTKDLSHDSRSPGRDLKPGSPEYDGGLLNTWPRPSVVMVGNKIKNKWVTYKLWLRLGASINAGVSALLHCPRMFPVKLIWSGGCCSVPPLRVFQYCSTKSAEAVSRPRWSSG